MIKKVRNNIKKYIKKAIDEENKINFTFNWIFLIFVLLLFTILFVFLGKRIQSIEDQTLQEINTFQKKINSLEKKINN